MWCRDDVHIVSTNKNHKMLQIMKKILFVLLVLVAFIGCKKENGQDTTKTTKVMFYTNIQALINNWKVDYDVNVYLDDELCGTLRGAYSPTETDIPCDIKDDSNEVLDGWIIIANVTQGEHKFKAVCVKNENMVCTGVFNVTDKDCQSVFIDFFEDK